MERSLGPVMPPLGLPLISNVRPPLRCSPRNTGSLNSYTGTAVMSREPPGVHHGWSRPADDSVAERSILQSYSVRIVSAKFRFGQQPLTSPLIVQGAARPNENPTWNAFDAASARVRIMSCAGQDLSSQHRQIPGRPIWPMDGSSVSILKDPLFTSTTPSASLRTIQSINPMCAGR